MRTWLENGRAGLVQSALRTLRSNIVHNRSGLPPFRLAQVAEQIVCGIEAFATSGDVAAVRTLGERLAEQGLGLRSLLTVLRTITQEVATHAPTGQLEELADLLIEGAASFEVHDVVRQRDEMQAAAERAARAREGELRQVIEELSTPIMPIHDRVLVVPLVGSIDDARAAQITENLLHAVVQRKARIILMDVTGVPAIDANVAARLTHTARAVQLIGAQAVLVGVRPELATVLVDAGVDLAGLRTLADLRGGIEWALGQQGLVVVARSGTGRTHGD